MAATDRSHAMRATELTKFQQDLLFVIADIGPAKGTRVSEETGEYYLEEINHGRLYPNLDTLVDHGLLSKDQRDKRTNEYELTTTGKRLLENRHEWEAARLERVSA